MVHPKTDGGQSQDGRPRPLPGANSLELQLPPVRRPAAQDDARGRGDDPRDKVGEVLLAAAREVVAVLLANNGRLLLPEHLGEAIGVAPLRPVPLGCHGPRTARVLDYIEGGAKLTPFLYPRGLH